MQPLQLRKAHGALVRAQEMPIVRFVRDRQPFDGHRIKCEHETVKGDPQAEAADGLSEQGRKRAGERGGPLGAGSDGDEHGAHHRPCGFAIEPRPIGPEVGIAEITFHEGGVDLRSGNKLAAGVALGRVVKLGHASFVEMEDCSSGNVRDLDAARMQPRRLDKRGKRPESGLHRSDLVEHACAERKARGNRVLPVRRRAPLRQRLVIPARHHPVDDVAADMDEFEVADLGIRIGFDPAHDLIESAGLRNAMSFGHHQPRCPGARRAGIHQCGEAAVGHRQQFVVRAEQRLHRRRLRAVGLGEHRDHPIALARKGLLPRPAPQRSDRIPAQFDHGIDDRDLGGRICHYDACWSGSGSGTEVKELLDSQFARCCRRGS